MILYGHPTSALDHYQTPTQKRETWEENLLQYATLLAGNLLIWRASSVLDWLLFRGHRTPTCSKLG